MSIQSINSIRFAGTNTIQKIVKNVHEGPIFSLCVLKDGSVVSGGGKDGRLVLLNQQLQPTGDETLVGSGYGAVRHIAEGRGDQLLIGNFHLNMPIPIRAHDCYTAICPSDDSIHMAPVSVLFYLSILS